MLPADWKAVMFEPGEFLFRYHRELTRCLGYSHLQAQAIAEGTLRRLTAPKVETVTCSACGGRGLGNPVYEVDGFKFAEPLYGRCEACGGRGKSETVSYLGPCG